MSNYIVESIAHYCNVSVKKCIKLPQGIIPYYDLTFVIKGSLTYFINGEKHVLEENDIMLLPPGTLRARNEGTKESRYVSFNFQILPDAKLDLPLFMPGSLSQNIRTLLKVYSQKYILPTYHSREKCINMLNYILFELLSSGDFESNNQTIRKIMIFIDENISLPITLAMISDHVYLSREHIASIFKKETGKTVMTYVTDRKMQIAGNMLKTTHFSLTDIASAIGYTNYAYFSRTFKKYFRTSPAKYRKMS